MYTYLPVVLGKDHCSEDLHVPPYVLDKGLCIVYLSTYCTVHLPTCVQSKDHWIVYLPTYLLHSTITYLCPR